MENKKSTYNKKTIAELSGLEERQVQFYTEQGVVLPEIDPGEGRGKTRLYSQHNLHQFLIIKGLVDFGMAISKIRSIIKHIEHIGKFDAMEGFEEKVQEDKELQLYVKIFQHEDDTLKVTLMLNRDKTWPVIKASEINDFNECLVINAGRIWRG